MMRVRIRRRADCRPAGLMVASVAIADGIAPTWRVRARHVPAILRLAAIILVLAALTGTLSRCAPGDRLHGALDIVMLIDVSQSMRAQDARPDRLTAATAFAQALVELRPRDRFGVVLFAGDDAIACPLTSDHRAVIARLGAVVVPDRSGTALGRAMLAAVKRFPEPRGGVLLIISDGTSNGGDLTPTEAAVRVRALGLRLMTAAVGRSGVAPFPTEAGIVRVPVDADEPALRSIANMGGGRFVRADDNGAAAAMAAFLDAVPSTRVAPSGPAASPWWANGIGSAVLAAEFIFAVFALKALV
jgi:Ca-activated chloride channel family protein